MLGWSTSVDEDAWWKANNLGHVPNDLYSIALHEMGHALVFNPGHDGFSGFYAVGEVRDAVVEAYYGSFPAMYKDHILGIDSISLRGAFGAEYKGGTPLVVG